MFVEVAGARLFVDVISPEYVIDGPELVRRPTIVLLHGGPGLDCSLNRSTGAHWAGFASVVVYDHLGNGRSDRATPADWTLDRWADDVRGLCDALGVERPIIVAPSFGGYVAMRYAARHPEHPAGLVLLSTAATNTDAASIEAFRRLAGDEVAEIVRHDYEETSEETSDLFVKHALPHMSRHPDAARISAEAFARSVRRQDVEVHFYSGEYQALDQRADCAAIRCPTLVVVGEDDPVTPPALSEIIAAAIPDGRARLHVLPGAATCSASTRPARRHA